MEFQHNEKIIKVVYRSWLAYFLAIFFALLLVVAACFFIVPLFNFGWWGKAIFWLVIVLGVFLGLRTIIVAFTSRLIITNQRLIFYWRQGLFNQSIVKIDFEQIKNISLVVKGFLTTIFKFGVLTISLNNQPEIINFSPISQPYQIQELLLQLQSKKRKANVEEMDDYELIDLARQIRHRLGRDVLRRVADEQE
ncbi:MAG: PH domain-containing protein [Patescibacteria group bacterium]|nr:PH domain-containing protein [Patescibacteria group bacterium]MDD5121080.1 PH domain-containing protein [Patescibacteria group bacterium]MDD5221990.1 PH domain-containing protein [Patescibacteria group bacterium]MDD5396001.1 PH domain-containing protein [Patescibacteria group bacterium]